MLAKNIKSELLINDKKVIQRICLEMNDKHEIDELVSACQNGKMLNVTIKIHREKRSLTANAYFWVLCQKLAEVTQISHDEMYLNLLERYGVGIPVIVTSDAVGKMRQTWRTVREIGEGKINGRKAIQLMCYFGSSTYDTKEMSRLIDGVVSECKEVGIETMSQQNIDSLLESEDLK